MTSSYAFLDYRVRDFMVHDPVTIGPEATLVEADRVFGLLDFNALPVVDAGRRLVGVLTKLDVLRAVAFTPETIVPHYAEALLRPVAEVMTRSVDAVELDTFLTRVVETLVTTRHKSLPVVEDGRLVGLIAREEVLRALEKARTT